MQSDMNLISACYTQEACNEIFFSLPKIIRFVCRKKCGENETIQFTESACCSTTETLHKNNVYAKTGITTTFNLQ